MTTQTRLPTGNSTTSGWNNLANGTTNQWLEVDDPVGTPDDDTSCIRRPDTPANHQFTFSAFSVPAGATINRVSVYSRHRCAGNGGTWSHTGRIRSGTTNFSSATTSVSSTSYVDRRVDWLTNPATSVAWTVDDVNGVSANSLNQFGLGGAGIASGEEARCTQLYVEVDYTAGASAVSFDAAVALSTSAAAALRSGRHFTAAPALQTTAAGAATPRRGFTAAPQLQTSAAAALAPRRGFTAAVPLATSAQAAAGVRRGFTASAGLLTTAAAQLRATRRLTASLDLRTSASAVLGGRDVVAREGWATLPRPAGWKARERPGGWEALARPAGWSAPAR